MAFDFFVEDSGAGLATDPILMHAAVTTDSSGNFTVNMTDVNYSSVFTVQATTKDTASGVTNTTVTSVTTFNTTTVYQFSETLGILNLAAVGSGRTVYVTVVGSIT